MRDRVDLLVCSTLLMGWGRSLCYNEDFLNQMSQQILKLHEEGNFFEPGQELEVVNVLSGMSQLGYRNGQVIEVLHGYLLGKNY